MKKKIRWIVETGVFLALLIVLQAVTKPLGQVVTGSCVNFLLASATLLCGMASGLTIAIISPFLALLLGIAPLPIYIVPVVAFGSAVLVLVYGLLAKPFAARSKNTFVVLSQRIFIPMVGSAAKFLALYAGVNWIVLPIMTTVTGTVAKAPAMVFSAIQMVTALIGGILAANIIPVVKKALNR